MQHCLCFWYLPATLPSPLTTARRLNTARRMPPRRAPQIAAALQRIADSQGMAAATRVPAHVAAAVVELAPGVTYHQAARILVLKSATTKQQRLPGSVALVCAGTADTAVVEECRLMLASCGCYAFKLAESGVMGMHRIVQVRRRRACRTGKL